MASSMAHSSLPTPRLCEGHGVLNDHGPQSRNPTRHRIHGNPSLSRLRSSTPSVASVASVTSSVDSRMSGTSFATAISNASSLEHSHEQATALVAVFGHDAASRFARVRDAMLGTDSPTHAKRSPSAREIADEAVQIRSRVWTPRNTPRNSSDNLLDLVQDGESDVRRDSSIFAAERRSALDHFCQRPMRRRHTCDHLKLTPSAPQHGHERQCKSGPRVEAAEHTKLACQATLQRQTSNNSVHSIGSPDASRPSTRRASTLSLGSNMRMLTPDHPVVQSGGIDPWLLEEMPLSPAFDQSEHDMHQHPDGSGVAGPRGLLRASGGTQYSSKTPRRSLDDVLAPLSQTHRTELQGLCLNIKK